MSNRPDWDDQFRETDEERAERQRARRLKMAQTPDPHFCRTPDKCAGFTRCPSDPVCND